MVNRAFILLLLSGVVGTLLGCGADTSAVEQKVDQQSAAAKAEEYSKQMSEQYSRGPQ